MNKVSSVIQRVQKLVEPSNEQRYLVENVYTNVKEVLSKELKRVFPDFDITLQGSVAKDTFLPDEVDLDVFVLFPETVSKEWFEKVFVNIVINTFKNYGPEILYAEHPYVRINMKGIEVDIVPAYRLRPGEKPRTAVDRTPLHTKYVIDHLAENQRKEVRLLKLFMKTLGIYGAEIKVKGFSGYLCELLVIAYGSFLEVLRAATKWRPFKICIDIEKHYTTYKDCLETFRNSPLVVVDPVDPLRNAASAVSLKSLARFMAAAFSFLEKPSENYFTSEQVENYVPEIVKNLGIASIIINIPRLSPDVLWGELQRVAKRFADELKYLGFEVIDVGIWSDEKKVAIIIAETIPQELPSIELHIGPPAWNFNHVKKFIEKNRGVIISGPWIRDDGKVVILRPRKVRKLKEAIERRLNLILIAPHINLESIKEICTDIECLEKYTRDYRDLMPWLKKHLKKRDKALLSMY